MKQIADIVYGQHERNVLDLYLPDEAIEPVPLVVCIHGGGWSGGDKSGWGWQAETLVNAGVAAASVNYRLAPDWPFPAAVDDVQRAVRWLRHHAREHGGIDPVRFGAIGDSAGGHLASFLGLTETRQHAADDLSAWSSRVGCVVNCYGPVDHLWMMRAASAPIIERFLARPLSAESAATYLAASPMAQISAPVCPFLSIHGTLDTGERLGDVPIDISRRFTELLRAAGGEADLLIIDQAGHGFMASAASTDHSRQGMDAAVAFFQRHLFAQG